jgi:hypothetical protein
VQEWGCCCCCGDGGGGGGDGDGGGNGVVDLVLVVVLGFNATSSCRVTLAKSPLGLLKSTYVARQ